MEQASLGICRLFQPARDEKRLKGSSYEFVFLVACFYLYSVANQRRVKLYGAFGAETVFLFCVCTRLAAWDPCRWLELLGVTALQIINNIYYSLKNTQQSSPLVTRKSSLCWIRPL